MGQHIGRKKHAGLVFRAVRYEMYFLQYATHILSLTGRDIEEMESAFSTHMLCLTAHCLNCDSCDLFDWCDR
jgi:hypothetical protein